MSIGNCKNCTYWKSHVGALNKRWHTCEASDWVEITKELGDDEFAIYADASDDTGLTAGLKTGPMFGCVKFQPSSK